MIEKHQRNRAAVNEFWQAWTALDSQYLIDDGEGGLRFRFDPYHKTESELAAVRGRSGEPSPTSA